MNVRAAGFGVVFLQFSVYSENSHGLQVNGRSIDFKDLEFGMVIAQNRVSIKLHSRAESISYCAPPE